MAPTRPQARVPKYSSPFESLLKEASGGTIPANSSTNLGERTSILSRPLSATTNKKLPTATADNKVPTATSSNKTSTGTSESKSAISASTDTAIPTLPPSTKAQGPPSPRKILQPRLNKPEDDLKRQLTAALLLPADDLDSLCSELRKEEDIVPPPRGTDIIEEKAPPSPRKILKPRIKKTVNDFEPLLCTEPSGVDMGKKGKKNGPSSNGGKAGGSMPIPSMIPIPTTDAFMTDSPETESKTATVSTSIEAPTDVSMIDSPDTESTTPTVSASTQAPTTDVSMTDSPDTNSTTPTVSASTQPPTPDVLMTDVPGSSMADPILAPTTDILMDSPAPSTAISDTVETLSKAAENNAAQDKTIQDPITAMLRGLVGPGKLEKPSKSKARVKPQAPTPQALPIFAPAGNAADVPATPSTSKLNYWNNANPEEDYDGLLQKYNNLLRAHESLQVVSTKDFNTIAELQADADKINAETRTAKQALDAAERKIKDLENAADWTESTKAAYEKPLQDEKQQHKHTKKRYDERNQSYLDLEKMMKATLVELQELKRDHAALKETVADKEGLVAGADEQCAKLQEELQTMKDEVEHNKQASVFLDIVNKDLEKSFSSIGQHLTPQNLVKRFRELEQQEPQQPFGINRSASGSNLHRDMSNTSLDSHAEFGKSLPKHRPIIDRKISLGDELDRAVGSDDELSIGGGDDDETITTAEFLAEKLRQEEMLVAARQAAEKAKKEGEEKGKRIKALEKELGARPANGNLIGTVAAPAAKEKVWWEVVLGAPWWVKLVLLLLFVLWASATAGALHERQRWLWANVTPEMVRFYASPPTLGGLVGHLIGQGSGVMFG